MSNYLNQLLNGTSMWILSRRMLCGAGRGVCVCEAVQQKTGEAVSCFFVRILLNPIAFSIFLREIMIN